MEIIISIRFASNRRNVRLQSYQVFKFNVVNAGDKRESRKRRKFYDV